MEGIVVIKKLYLLYCEIIGFKNIVKQNETTPSNLEEKISELHDTLKKAESLSADAEKTKGHVKRSEKGSTQKKQIHMISLTDRFIFYTNDDSPSSDLVMNLAALAIIPNSLSCGFGIRGGISHGEVCVDIERNILFGAPLERTKELVEKIEMIGIARVGLEGTSEQDDLKELQSGEIPLSLTYELPKGSPTKSLHLTNWPIFWNKDNSPTKSLLPPIGKDFHRILENTESFFRYCFEKNVIR
jgi:hypothetical protein